MMKNDSEPFFSIIVPTYNTGEKLKKAIDSVIDQTFTDWEMIIIDDGSSNSETLDILNKYECDNERIRIIHQNNKGVSAARNTGLINSVGKYVIMLDADDYFDVNLLEDNWNIINQSNEKIDIVMREMIIHYEDYHVEEKTSYFTETKKYKDEDKNELIAYLFNSGLFSNKGGCYLREIIEENDEYYIEGCYVCEDIDWHLRQMINANVIYVTKNYGYNYCLYARQNWETIQRFMSQIEMSEKWTSQNISKRYPSEVEKAVRNRLSGLFVHFSIRINYLPKEDQKKAKKLCREHIKIAKKSDSFKYRLFYYSVCVLPIEVALFIWRSLYRIIKSGREMI